MWIFSQLWESAKQPNKSPQQAPSLGLIQYRGERMIHYLKYLIE